MNSKKEPLSLDDSIMEKIKEFLAWYPDEDRWHIVVSRMNKIKYWHIELRDKDGSIKLKLPPQGQTPTSSFVVYLYGVVDGMHEQIRKCLEG